MIKIISFVKIYNINSTMKKKDIKDNNILFRICSFIFLVFNYLIIL